jgi:uncharacterized protein (UPF0548 family)
VGAHRIERHLLVLSGVCLDGCGAALVRWDLHRGAGLTVAAEADAAVGATVVLGIRLGPTRIAAPCRVVEITRSADRVAFTYATLPGHPEQGVEEFAFTARPHGVVFSLRAVSRPRFWASRLLPRLHDRVQTDVTDRYVRAAMQVGTADPTAR